MEKELVQIIKNAIDQEVQSIAQQLTQEYSEKLKDKIAEVVAGIAINLQNRISIARNGEELVLTVLIKEIK